jgi:mono/diheme cytochrome c family protein/glucose/arabinose dehydrogenase
MRPFPYLATTIAFALVAPAFAQQKLELKKGDHIAIVGSGLADRQQHHAWLESLIHKAYPGLELTVRNLGFAADEVNVHPRSDEVPTTEQFLNMKPGTTTLAVGKTEVTYHWGADFHANVILAYWGFNESFKGEAGVADFKKALDEYLKNLAKADYGKGKPRVVLLSPIAHENVKDPTDYPDGSANNKNLAIYTKAMAEVAKDNGVQFVDLFAPSQQLYAQSRHPLTINGIHLTEEGDKMLAPVQFKAIFGKEAPSTTEPALEKIRAAVLEKNVQWHHRYRTVDQYNIYGQRSRIKYADPNDPKNAPDNATIMGEEMAQRDVKVANRDKAVWAAAQGKKFTVKDDNLPSVDKVPPNRFGPIPVATKEAAAVNTTNAKPSPKSPLRPFIEKGADTLKYIKVPEGCKVDFVASEKEFPELINPVQMNFDTRGRLWVAVWPNYPETTPTTKVFDKLVIFDIDPKTGKFTKCTTFADGLNCPTGFQLYKDGVIVMQSPDMWFLRDSTGKGLHADTRERLVHGLDAADSHHETNSICYEPGGAVYFSDGVFHRTNVETLNGPVRNTNGAIYRFEPRTSRFDRYVPYGFANPHGRVFDYWGNDIITDATGNASYFAPAFSGHLDSGAHPGMKQFWNRPSRPCPGTAILSSGHFPDDWQGQFLNTNVIGFQGIFRAKVSEDGSGLKGETIDPLVEGLLGDDEHEGNPNFRPSGIAVAPDGSMYFLDWSQMLIGHLQHHLRDPNRHHDYGRIYRITYPSRPLLTPKKIAGEPIEKLLELLKEHEDNVRMRAKIELDTHDTKQVIAAVEKWEKALDKKNKDYEHNRLEALWVHQWHNVVNLDLLNAVLKSPEPKARAQAVRVLCYWMDRVPNTMALLDAAVKDSAPRVRLDAVRALSFIKGKDVPQAIELAKLVMMEKDYYIDYCFRETMKQLGSLPEAKDLISKDPILAARLRAAPDAKFGPTRKKLTGAEQKAYDLGKEVFNRDAHCVTCHQADGKGIENMYPPIAKSEWLDNDERMIKIVLKGLFGPLKFQGKEYGKTGNTPPMIGFGPLANDEEIAAVISYVRQSFGNDLDFVKAEDVKRIREQVKDRNIFYMIEDILKENPLGQKKAAPADKKPAEKKADEKKK